MLLSELSYCLHNHYSAKLSNSPSSTLFNNIWVTV